MLSIIFHDSPARGRGPAIEWVNKALTQLVSSAGHPDSLFEFSDERALQIVPRPAQLGKFRSVGRVIGLAIHHQVRVHFPLTLASFNLLVDPFGGPTDQMELLRDQNPSGARGLETLLRSPIQPGMLTFRDSDVEVTPDNLSEYVQSQVAWETTDRIRSSVMELLKGIYDVLPLGQLSWLSREELRNTLTVDSRPVNLGALRAATLISEEDRNDNLVQWLWDCLDDFPEQDRQAFLAFFSAQSAEPLDGFGGPDGTRKWLLISFAPEEAATNFLPSARTCFRQIILPPYTSIEIMKEKLLYAIRNGLSIELY